MNAPESAQIGRPSLKATRRDVDALSKVRQNWYVYFRDGAFTFARYEKSFWAFWRWMGMGSGKCCQCGNVANGQWGGRGEWFLATKNAKGTKVGNGMGAVRKGHVYSLRDNGLR